MSAPTPTGTPAAAGDPETPATPPPETEPDEPEQGPIRRSIVSGDRLDKGALLRFVVAPDNEVVPDLEEKLPGRGFWVEATRDALRAAMKKRAFDRAARRTVRVPADLADRIEFMLADRCRDAIGLARRASLAVCGFEKVSRQVRAGKAAVLLSATEGGRDSRRKLQSLAPDVSLLTVLTGAELGIAFGRDHVGHAVLGPGRMAERLLVDGGRLAGFRAMPPRSAAVSEPEGGG